MHRKTISRELFTSIALVLLLSLALMCGIQSALSIAYFSNERMSALTSVLDGATALSQRFADQGSDVTRPITDEALKENIESGFELFHTSADAVIFITDPTGKVILHTEAADLTGASAVSYTHLHCGWDGSGAACHDGKSSAGLCGKHPS